MLGREVLMPYDLTKEGSSVMFDLKKSTCQNNLGEDTKSP
jgi:hypothetical protein